MHAVSVQCYRKWLIHPGPGAVHSLVWLHHSGVNAARLVFVQQQH